MGKNKITKKLKGNKIKIIKNTKRFKTINLSISIFIFSLILLLIVLALPKKVVSEKQGFIDSYQICRGEIDLLIKNVTTNFNSNLIVHYGIDKSYGQLYEDKEFKKTHKIVLSKLLPDKTYFLKIIACKKREDSACELPNDSECIIIEDATVKSEPNIDNKADYIAYFQPKNIEFDMKSPTDAIVTINGDLIEKIETDKEVNIELLNIIISNNILKESNLKYEGTINVNGEELPLIIENVYGEDKWNYHYLKLTFKSQFQKKTKQVKITAKLTGRIVSKNRGLLFPFETYSGLVGLQFINKKLYENTKYCNTHSIPCEYTDSSEEQMPITCTFEDERKAKRSIISCGHSQFPIRIPMLPKSTPNFNLLLPNKYELNYVEKSFGVTTTEFLLDKHSSTLILNPEEDKNLFAFFYNAQQPNNKIYLIILPIIFLYLLYFITFFSKYETIIIQKIKPILKSKIVPPLFILGYWFYWIIEFDFQNIFSLFSLFYLLNLIAIIMIAPSENSY